MKIVLPAALLLALVVPGRAEDKPAAGGANAEIQAEKKEFHKEMKEERQAFKEKQHEKRKAHREKMKSMRHKAHEERKEKRQEEKKAGAAEGATAPAPK